jgi:hypothetical protein
MTQYLSPFDNAAMGFPEADLPEVREAGHAVIQTATDAGVFVFTSGLKYDDGLKRC